MALSKKRLSSIVSISTDEEEQFLLNQARRWQKLHVDLSFRFELSMRLERNCQLTRDLGREGLENTLHTSAFCVDIGLFDEDLGRGGTTLYLKLEVVHRSVADT